MKKVVVLRAPAMVFFLVKYTAGEAPTVNFIKIKKRNSTVQRRHSKGRRSYTKSRPWGGRRTRLGGLYRKGTLDALQH